MTGVTRPAGHLERGVSSVVHDQTGNEDKDEEDEDQDEERPAHPVTFVDVEACGCRSTASTWKVSR